MQVIATRQIHGVYGTKLKGQQFELEHGIAAQLLKSGLVRTPADFEYETKAIMPESGSPTVETPTATHANKRK